MRIATWNVNSVRQRIELLVTWLKECQPDVVCLQEIKCVDDAFPRLEIEALGYNVVTHGQKTFNGVALLSKLPFEETKSGLAGDDEDAHARFLEGVVPLKRGVLRIACLYLPNGNPPETEKYPYKLKWMSRLLEYSKERLKTEEPLVLAGDFNVIPAARDVHNPAAWVSDALLLYVAGYCLEASIVRERAADEDAAWVLDRDELLRRFTALPTETFPHVTRHAAELVAGEGHDRFDFTVATMIDGLAHPEPNLVPRHERPATHLG